MANKKAAVAAPVQKFKLSAKFIIVAVTALALLATIITASVILIVDAVKRDVSFDYIGSDLRNYVDLSLDDYKNYELELSIAKPHEIDVDVAILNLVSAKEYRTLVGDGTLKNNVAVTAGDMVRIYYKGYTHNDDGEEVIVSTAMSNFTLAKPTDLQIGDANEAFPVGFELGLIGKNPQDYAKFGKITSGKAADHEHGDKWVIYVSFERLVEGGDSKKDTVKATSMRIDLEDSDVEKVFGEGFLSKIKNFNVGDTYNDVTVKINGKNYTYSNLVINFATTCEKAETSENGKAPLVVEGYMPYDYGIDGTATAGLRNKTVYYQVFIDYVQQYDTPEFNDEFVLKVIGEKGSKITEEELSEYEGESLTDKYRAYAKELIYEAYEEAYDIMVEDAMWNHYLKKAKIKKYPGIKVDEIHSEYIDDVYYQYDYNGGTLSDSEGTPKSYDNIDDFARAYLSLAEGADWRNTLYTMSESLVKERLILYYIMKAENILPTAEKLAEKVAEIKKEYLDEYIRQYLEYQKKTEDDFSEDEYKQFCAEREAEIFEYYDNDYFQETAYYELALETLRTYPTVYTLDNPKPAEDK